MSTIAFVKSKINEVQYFLNYFTQHIAEYRLYELTAGNSGDVPSIQIMHPLAMEYGSLLTADESGNYTSVLPAIGIELINDSENSMQFIGSGQSQIEITEAMILYWEGLTAKQRIDAGIMLTNDNLILLRDAYDLKEDSGLKLYATQYHYLQLQTVNVSIWSQHYDVTRTVYQIVRALLKRAKHDVSLLGVKNLTVNGQTALYNYEFDRTLFGAEIEISFVNEHVDIIVNTSTLVISDIKEFMFTNNDDEKVEFVHIGE